MIYCLLTQLYCEVVSAVADYIAHRYKEMVYYLLIIVAYVTGGR